MIGHGASGYVVPDQWHVEGRGHGNYALVRRVDCDTWTITAADGPFVPESKDEEVLLSHYAGNGWEEWDGIAMEDWTMPNVMAAVLAVHEVSIGTVFVGQAGDMQQGSN